MAKRKNSGSRNGGDVADYRHKGVSRLNIPPAGLAARGEIAREPALKWAYNPHLAPTLRFDAAGQADRIETLLDAASRRPLAPEETALLKAALRNHEPWLEWAGKREQPWCVADPVALHIHERLSTQAVLKVAKRLDVQRDLFADPQRRGLSLDARIEALAAIWGVEPSVARHVTLLYAAQYQVALDVAAEVL